MVNKVFAQLQLKTQNSRYESAKQQSNMGATQGRDTCTRAIYL